MKVFSSEWFEEHKDRLLHFANTWFGRKLLTLPEGRIIGLTPEGCSVLKKLNPETGEAYIETLTYTAPQYALLLKQKLAPLWASMHFLDWLVLDRFPKMVPNFGFYTYTWGPTVSDYVYWSPWENLGNTHWNMNRNGIESFATKRAATYAQAGYADANGAIAGFSFDSSKNLNGLFRSQIVFNTGASIPVGAVIKYTNLLSYHYSDGGNPSYIGYSNLQAGPVCALWQPTSYKRYNSSSYNPGDIFNTQIYDYNIASMGPVIGSRSFSTPSSWTATNMPLTWTSQDGSYIGKGGSTPYTKVGVMIYGDCYNIAPGTPTYGGIFVLPSLLDYNGSYAVLGNFGYSPALTVGYNLPFKVNVSDVWKQGTTIKVNVADVWHDVVAIKVNVGDTWYDVF